MFTTKLKSIPIATMIIVSACVVANGQMNQRLVEAQQQNARALLQYEWKSRTEILKDGESKKTQVTALRYDASGALQRTTISSTPEPDLPSFGLRGHIARKKKKEFLEKIDQLAALAKGYGNLPADVMQRFMTSASFTPGQDLIRIEGRNVLQTGDRMVIFLDAVSRKQRRIQIQTALDEKPVVIVTEFRDVAPSGPSYAARSQVSYDGESVVLITENFDYKLVQN